MTAPITAIIVTYHSGEVLPQCIASLHGAVQEIIIIDNGGTPAPPAEENILFLRNRKNLGFGRAVNRALQKTRTPFALLINPDASLRRGALQKLLAAADACPEAAIIAPMLEDSNGQLRTGWRLGHFRRARKTEQEILGPFCAGHLAAAVWLMRMDAVRKIGPFDRRIFLFYEDDDYTLRTRRAGFSLLVEPAARALHLQGQSSPATAHSTWLKNFHYAFSECYFFQKHRGTYSGFLRCLRILFNNSFRLLGALLRFDKTALIAASARLCAATVFLTRRGNWSTHHRQRGRSSVG